MINEDKTPEDILAISQILKKHFLFYNLDEFQINEIIEGMFTCTTDAGEYVFKQHSMGHTFFLVKEGEIEILIGGDVKRVLGKGAYFGDLALIYNAPRSAGIRCKTKVVMWGISRDMFQRLVRALKLKQYKVNRDALNSVNSFSKVF